jgi:hypothetical protein
MPKNSEINLKNLEFNQKLKIFLELMEAETGRPVKIQLMPPDELYKMQSAFLHHPKYILILLSDDSEPKDPVVEQSIAHEAAHGLLVYKLKYCIGFFKGTPDDAQKKLVTLLFTMVSDIVVNWFIRQAGILPYSPRYPRIITEEIEAMREGVNLYAQNEKDASYRDKLLAFRYVLAWGYLKFIDIDEEVYELLTEYTKLFQKLNPEQYRSVQNIQKIILKYDIFKSEGYKQAIQSLLRLWELEELVELKTV